MKYLVLIILFVSCKSDGLTQSLTDDEIAKISSFIIEKVTFDTYVKNYVDSLNEYTENSKLPQFLYIIELDNNYYMLSQKSPRESMRQSFMNKVTNVLLLQEIIKTDTINFSISPNDIDENNCYNQEFCKLSLKEMALKQILTLTIDN